MFGHDDHSDDTKQDEAASVDNTAAAAAADNEVTTPDTSSEPAAAATPASDTLNPRDLPTPTGSSDLLSIKQEALQQLSPLVDHLNQTPEERFRTTMMMIQATDDQSLVKNAYDAAKSISDDKTRAQALLDIINEINYFTQQQAA